MTKHLNILVYGDVQGVFFRRTIKHEAGRRKISGFVENKPDGTVYIEAEAETSIVDSFVEWIRAGADGHRVIRVESEEGSYRALDAFEIKES